MHQIAQNNVNGLRLRTQTLRKRYSDFTQLLTQDEVISGLCPHTFRLTNLVMRYPGFGIPLMFASNLLKRYDKLACFAQYDVRRGCSAGKRLHTCTFWCGCYFVFLSWNYRNVGGIARIFPGEQAAHREDHIEEENEEILRKMRENTGGWEKNWGNIPFCPPVVRVWLRPWKKCTLSPR